MTDKKFPGNTVFNTELFLKNGEIIDPDDVGVALNAAPHPVAMTEITQADRDAAASAYYAWFNGSPVIPTKMKQGQVDHHTMIQAFARHRMEERAAIVAWLRDDADQVVNANSPVSCADVIAEAIVECAVGIEAGEHLK